jgi:hypothetical protein
LRPHGLALRRLRSAAQKSGFVPGMRGIRANMERNFAACVLPLTLSQSSSILVKADISV